MIKGRFSWTAAYFAAVAMTASVLTAMHPATAAEIEPEGISDDE